MVVEREVINEPGFKNARGNLLQRFHVESLTNIKGGIGPPKDGLQWTFTLEKDATEGGK